MSFTFVDLFCGAGGLSCGLAQAGFAPLAAFDNWPPALRVYSRNIGPHAHLADLSDTRTIIDQIKPLAPDIVAGGPPCQDFSAAGRRIEGDRAACMLDFAEIAAVIQSPWVVIENVDGAVSSQAFAMAIHILAKANYGISYAILDASLCGAPQRRKRLICVGRLGVQHDFLVKRLVTGGADRPMTLKDYFGASLSFRAYYSHPCFYDRRAVYSTAEPAPTIRGTSRGPALGYRGHKKDAADFRQVRALTQQERSLVQTFPASWVWEGTKTEIDRLIGNAVPPALGAYIGRAILDGERLQNSPLRHCSLLATCEPHKNRERGKR